MTLDINPTDATPTLSQLGHLRGLLTKEISDTKTLIEHLQRELTAKPSTNFDQPIGDEAESQGPTRAIEKSQLGAILAQQENHAREMHAAMRRMDSGLYGVCEICAAPIPLARLEARPSAVRCVGCAK